VRGLYGELLNGHNGELAVVGDFDPAAIAPLLAALDNWKSPAPYARLVREMPARLEYGKQVIQTPDKANAIYLAAALMPMSNADPDYPALVIANYILGGGSLSSRLGDRVRQKEGLSYGVGSGFSAQSLDKRAAWQIQAITNPLNIGKVEQAIREELEKLLKDGVTAEEVARAKGGYLQQQQVVRASDERLAGLLADTLYESRTMAYYLELEKAVQTLDAASVTETARKHWDPKKMVLITAGDFAKSSPK
jgi:zinc protease